MLQRKDLWSLEDYSRQRENFRVEVIAHKKNRWVVLGDHVLLIFEDNLTINRLKAQRTGDRITFGADHPAYLVTNSSLVNIPASL